LSKSKKLKYISTTLSILTLLSIVGPWSCFNISLNSQKRILYNLLVNNNFLIDEKIHKRDSSSVEFEDRKSISSIISYLYETKSIEKIEFLSDLIDKLAVEKEKLNGKDEIQNRNTYGVNYKDKNEKVSRVVLVEEGLGFKFISKWETVNSNKNLYIRSLNDLYILNIEKYNNKITFNNNFGYKDSTLYNNKTISISYNRKKALLKISKDNKISSIEVNLLEIVNQLNLNKEKTTFNSKDLTFISNDNDNSINNEKDSNFQYMIIFKSFSIKKEDGSNKKLSNPIFDLYFSLE